MLLFIKEIAKGFINVFLGTFAASLGERFNSLISNKLVSQNFIRDVENMTKVFLLGDNNKKIFLDKKTTETIEALKSQIDHFDTNDRMVVNLLFIGAPGTGKTHAMRMIENYIKQKMKKMGQKIVTFFLPGSFFSTYSGKKSVSGIHALFERIFELIKKKVHSFDTNR